METTFYFLIFCNYKRSFVFLGWLRLLSIVIPHSHRNFIQEQTRSFSQGDQSKLSDEVKNCHNYVVEHLQNQIKTRDVFDLHVVNMNTFVNVDAFVREEEQYPSPSRSAMNLPIGYRFLPTDEELIVHYLKRKVYSQPLSYNNIPTVNYVLGGDDEEKEWYLFSPRKRISSGGTRVDRTTPYGYWKASTDDMPIKHNGEVVGYRNTLVYCKCKSPAGTVKKTDWIMHEYRLKDLPKLVDAAENINRLSDEIVLCRIHNHNKNYRRNCNEARYTQYQRSQSIPTIEKRISSRSFHQLLKLVIVPIHCPKIHLTVLMNPLRTKI
ncbi:NAC domain-containing protein 86 [Sesamum angolense]|uniref:NAC domain-containing protein 86 n=1 Tax=Sesamum angolense TaxID=2727404 RepID=A0AAE1W0Z4_9LAMI|nr:NAC domain-containing protein 86 [Sesamum angolense]